MSTTTSMSGISIVVPIYNEIDGLPALHEALTSYMTKASMPCDVLYVDDGSTDGSSARLRELVSDAPNCSLVSFEANAGLSAAITAGIHAATKEWTGYIDADLQTTPDDFELLWRERGHHALVTGIRADRQDSWIKLLSSRIGNGIRRAFTKDGIDDTGCPLKIIRSDVARQIPMFKGLHRFLPAMVLLQHETVHQVPVRHFPRTTGESKFNIGNRFWGPLMDCIAYRWMKKKYIRYQIKDATSRQA